MNDCPRAFGTRTWRPPLRAPLCTAAFALASLTASVPAFAFAGPEGLDRLTEFGERVVPLAQAV